MPNGPNGILKNLKKANFQNSRKAQSPNAHRNVNTKKQNRTYTRQRKKVSPTRDVSLSRRQLNAKILSDNTRISIPPTTQHKNSQRDNTLLFNITKNLSTNTTG